MRTAGNIYLYLKRGLLCLSGRSQLAGDQPA